MASLLLVLAILCSCKIAVLAQQQQQKQPPQAPAVDEKQILAEFKQGFNGTLQALNNWDELSNHCNWSGIVCSNTSSVVTIDFTNFNLSGTISPVICQLPQLTTLRFAFNNFQQPFPSQLESCSQLRVLDLSQNYFFGALPSSLSSSKLASSLRVLDLTLNNFNGTIPATFGDLFLNVLILAGNLLTGPLPPELGNISQLSHLDVCANPLSSNIPPELGKLTKLNYLALHDCQLIGSLPPQLGTLKELRYLGLHVNNLTGTIPPELMFLPKLKQLQLYVNQLSGELPHEIDNLVSLEDLDASQNALNGSIPEKISLLKNLQLLQLYHNRLTGELPPGMADLPLLGTVSLYSNSFTGSIPQLFGSNSNLTLFDVSKNKLTGSMPPHLCKGGSLQNMTLFRNMLTGEIPESYGSCQSLIRFQVHENNLSGPIPEGLWTGSNLTLINLGLNNLTGAVPSSIQRASRLQNILLSDNQLEGALPVELTNLPSLVKLIAPGNRFTGPVPFGRCASLENMDLSRNSLSGAIPAEVSNCLKLTVLDLSSNRLSGSISAALGTLPNLNALDLSKNNLSGAIPSNLKSLPLSSLDISNNNLRGPLPQGWKTSFSASSFIGNPGSCGWVQMACLGPETLSKHSTRQPVVWITVLVVTVSVLMVALGLRYIYRRHFDAMDVLERMDQRNIIGRGQSGEVYRVDLWDGKSVAVKQLWKSHAVNQQEFQAEIGTLGSIRHRNIVKLLSCCSSVKSDLLILEYMANGSLGDILHKRGDNLPWKIRLKIALGAAQGLSYLHHDCSPPVLHRDIKSNNILLDLDYEAKIADFGLARMFQDGSYHTMTDVAGSHGYIAPELVTAKKPVEKEFGEGVDIVKWTRSRVHTKDGPQQLMDFRLQSEHAEQVLALLKVAFLCTSASAATRPSARQVVEMKQLKHLAQPVNTSTSFSAEYHVGAM